MPMKICECCGTQFHARLSATRTCGVACRNRLIAAEKAEKHKRSKECPVCKSVFEVTGSNPNQQTCSKECSYKLRGDNRSDRVDMRCATCGDVFSALRSKAERGDPLYCSKPCWYGRNKTAMTRQCECCGQSFSSPPSHAHVRTCSPECGLKIRQTNEKEKVELRCEHCGKSFLEHESHAGRRRFCSRLCMNSSEELQRTRSETCLATGIHPGAEAQPSRPFRRVERLMRANSHISRSRRV